MPTPDDNAPPSGQSTPEATTAPVMRTLQAVPQPIKTSGPAQAGDAAMSNDAHQAWRLARLRHPALGLCRR